MAAGNSIKLITSLILLLAISGWSFAQDTGRQVITTPDSDYFGFDLRTEKDVTLDECKAECLADPGCRAFTYNSSAAWCFLKSDFSVLNTFEGAVAGRVVMSTGEPDIGAPPVLGFVPDWLRDGAIQYRTELLRNVPRDPQTGMLLLSSTAERALLDNNGVAAVNSFRRALAIDPDDGGLWARLARAALVAERQDSGNSWRLRQAAISAAINAHGLSRQTSVRATALGILGEALERREIWRPAITAYAESLKLVDDPRIRSLHEDLKARKGFRVVDNTIDSDSRSPRICVQFSESLVKTGVDYASFVSVNGTAANAIDAREREICINGVEHGHRYRVDIRPGLPAAIGEVIEKQVTLDLYVRDRAALTRFTGDNFVLPGAGRHGIPVVTVNTASIDLELFRVGDRSLAGLLADSRFLRQIDGYDANRIADSTGSKIWSGKLEVAVDQNREVITSFPVDEALPDRRPGVYVLTAKPEGDRRDNWDTIATQWFVVSDIGLSAISGEEGVNVFARSLASAEPLTGVELKLVARNNEVLATETTDADGRANFAAGLARGTGGLAPQVVTASAGEGDFVFLDLGRAGFDLSDRGVEGRPAPGALDLFAWTERGIYRAGETVHANALLRDGSAEAVDGLPLTFILSRPDGMEDRRTVVSDTSLGGYGVEFALQDNAMRGAWTMRIHTDPKRPALTEKIFLVEDFVPDRIEFDLTSEQSAISIGEPARVTVEGRYLYGAPAAGLGLEGEIKLRSTNAWDIHPRYQFGLSDEEKGEDRRIPLDNLPVLDIAGQATFDVSISDAPAVSGLLSADVTVRMREGGGRAVERELAIALKPDGPMIGVAPEFEGGAVQENSVAGFRVIAVSPDGVRQRLDDALWSLVKIERSYQWYRDGNNWKYEPVDYTTQVDSGTITIDADTPATISANVGWGRYRFQVESADADGPASSIEFYAGWYVEPSSTSTPDGLEIALDRDSYSAGDVARLKVSPRFAGELLVNIGAETILATQTAQVSEEGSEIEIPVDASWGAGAYVTATLIRPGDGGSSRMPMRAIGVKWLKIDPGPRKLDIAVDVPDQIQPRKTIDIPIKVTGAGAGEKAFVTLAAVDVGILNLTNYKTPDPDGWYFGQRRLGLEYRDIYGRLIDGSAGVAGRIRSGGDGPGMGSKGSPPTGKLVAFHSGIVEVDSNGEATISFDMPQFNGTVRLMAVAWSKSGVGHAEKDVVVRDPVVVTASLPKFMAPGDVADLRLEFANTDGPAGDYTLNVVADVPLSVPEGLRTVSLAAGARSELTIGISAIDVGQGSVVVSLQSPDGTTLDQALALPVRPSALPVASRFEIPLAANGGSLRIDSGLLDGSLLTGASVSVNVAQKNALDVPALLMSLDRYPYGCAEQTTSRALPLLYVSELSAAAGLEEDPEIAGRIQNAIHRVLAYQASSGGFGLWGPVSGDLWLDAYVTDFLTRAREQNFAVPDLAMRQALDNLQNTLAYNNDIKSNGNAIAYSLYVLARNRRASAGDLRYYADTQLQSFRTSMAQAHIAASLSLYGDNERAKRAFASAYRLAANSAPNRMRSDYGSALRDNAAMLALAAETSPVPASVPAMMELVTAGQSGKRYTSTQEQAWMLLAARAIDAGSPIDIAVDGQAHSGNFTKRMDGRALETEPLIIENRGDTEISAVVTAIAAPEQPLPAGGNGFTIERTYYRMDGTAANVSEARQNDRFVVIIKVTEENAWPSRVLVNDLLPAGFEIDNPRLVSSAELAEFAWLPQTQAAHVEFRNDRFVAAFNRSGRDSREFSFAYVVRAVTPGIYAHPAASVEDMYRPELSARTATGVMAVETR